VRVESIDCAEGKVAVRLARLDALTSPASTAPKKDASLAPQGFAPVGSPTSRFSAVCFKPEHLWVAAENG
jgi:hypothetical protein